MASRNEKPWLSVDDQLVQLVDRGMAISDSAKARDYLERIGYYRLSGYWYDMRVRDVPFCPLDPKTGRKPQKVVIERPVLDEFKPGTRFQDAVDLYVFGMEEGVLLAMQDVAQQSGQSWPSLSAALKKEGRLHLETY